MLKVGDRVFIDGSHEVGVVEDMHPHEVIVRVETPAGREDRRYAYESLRRDFSPEAATFNDR